uniref:Uncharacterized protein n=1 Tax=Lotharella oceanica TaxID=641309 RepID=A0A7S2XAB5_9EUKA|mmetsp:Transcript_22752/g.42735  ORF Transcript_22752/g.42735 Transcript_22752/m.42735 type:complete len:290 (+) Transcript_22752:113-982(+)
MSAAVAPIESPIASLSPDVSSASSSDLEEDADEECNQPANTASVGAAGSERGSSGTGKERGRCQPCRWMEWPVCLHAPLASAPEKVRAVWRGDLDGLVRCQEQNSDCELGGIDERGNSLLLLASCQAHTHLVDYLVQNSPEMVDVPDGHGQTALMIVSAMEGRRWFSCFRHLLKKGIANVNCRDNLGRTALIHAVRAPVQDKRVIDALMARRADTTIRDVKMKTAIDYSRHRYSMYTLSMQRLHRRQLHSKIIDTVERDCPAVHMLVPMLFEAIGNQAMEGITERYMHI